MGMQLQVCIRIEIIIMFVPPGISFPPSLVPLLSHLLVKHSIPNGQLVLSVLCPLQEINYDSPRGGVSVITEKGELTTSYLLVQRARVSDSGKYTCAPSNANPSTVSVHILSGTYPFRLTDVRRSTVQSCPCPPFHMSFLVCPAIHLSCT